MQFALFADQLDATSQTLAAGGWIGGVLGVISTVVTSVITARSARDRLQFDAQMQRLKDRLEYLEGELKETREAEERAVAAEDRCRKELADVRAELKSVTDYLLRKGVPALEIGGGK
jgi:hypothetical protein